MISRHAGILLSRAASNLGGSIRKVSLEVPEEILVGNQEFELKIWDKFLYFADPIN